MKKKSNPKPFDLQAYLKKCQKKVDQTLDHLLPTLRSQPDCLHQAMRYSVFAGGKRLRPVLLYGSARAVLPGRLGQKEEGIWWAAAALEILHTYSLIHDDLPAMDDDDLRRGKPTCHKAYDEATAILAGDALQALAFQILASLPETSDEIRIECLQVFAQAVGSLGMVGGQMLDLENEGNAKITANTVNLIHKWKTGALIQASCLMGAILAEGSQAQINALKAFGRSVGLAFQIIDDILDVVGSREELGKSIGKDKSSLKATYPAVYGLDRSRKKALEMVNKAKKSLEIFGEGATPLAALADYVTARKF